ncbi:MAG: trimethylamine methyltransferase family protein [Gammaproteobacteria bacterium]
MQDIARPRLTLLSAAQMHAVHETSLTILARSGLRLDSERARELCRKGDARVEGDRVYFHRDLVEAAVESAPASIEIFNRRGLSAFRLGDGETRFGSGVTNLWYQDPLTDELTPFSRADMAKCVRLCQALPNYDVISTLGVIRDLPPEVADLHAVLEMVANSTKPLVLLISDESLFPKALELLDAVRGDLGERPFVIPYLNPVTPLTINEGTSDKLLDSAARSIPVIYSNYGMSGMTTPLPCAGALALLNAELLGGLVLSQLAKPGAPIILGSLPIYFDMKTMIDFYDPQTHLINLACAEMMAGYGVPHAGTSGSGEGWGPDLLSAGASWMNQVTSVIGRVGLAPFVGSTLNSKAYSPAMTVYGDEVIGAARLFARGFPVDQASLGAEESVQQLAQEGHFLTAPSTLARYKSAYYPSLFPRIGLEKWVELGKPCADSLVRTRARDLLGQAAAPEDHDEILAKGEALIARL